MQSPCSFADANQSMDADKVGEAYVRCEDIHGLIDTKQSVVGPFERGEYTANVVV